MRLYNSPLYLCLLSLKLHLQILLLLWKQYRFSNEFFFLHLLIPIPSFINMSNLILSWYLLLMLCYLWVFIVFQYLFIFIIFLLLWAVPTLLRTLLIEVLFLIVYLDCSSVGIRLSSLIIIAYTLLVIRSTTVIFGPLRINRIVHHRLMNTCLICYFIKLLMSLNWSLVLCWLIWVAFNNWW
jgi:hypothetical protein